MGIRQVYKHREIVAENKYGPKNPKELIQSYFIEMGSTGSQIPMSKLKNLELIAAGSQGQVYRARYGRDDVAVKKYFVADQNPKGDLVQSWKREASILKSIRHPNILSFYGICLDACHVYLVTELASFSLSDVIFKPVKKEAVNAVPPSLHSSSGSEPFSLDDMGKTNSHRNPILNTILSPDVEKMAKQKSATTTHSLLRTVWNSGEDRDELIRKVALQTIQAVSFVHEQQIIHRDIKPDNLLVLEKGAVWAVQLADFGMARFRTAEQNNLTTLIGSPHYVAPELMKGEKNYTDSVDIYSFGMVVWALVHEQNPMNDAGVYTIVDKIVNRQERPEITNKCSPFLRSLISACW
jgi:serine/threonine protein kinase